MDAEEDKPTEEKPKKKKEKKKEEEDVYKTLIDLNQTRETVINLNDVLEIVSEARVRYTSIFHVTA